MLSFVKNIFDSRPPIFPEKIYPVYQVMEFMQTFKLRYITKVMSNSCLWVFGAYQELRRPNIIITYSVTKGEKSLRLSFVEYLEEVVDLKSEKLVYPFYEVNNCDLIAPVELEQFETVQIGKTITLIRIDQNSYDSIDMDTYTDRIFALLK